MTYTYVMRLTMLGGLTLEAARFNRPKPLLLLAYLAVEGSKEKRHLYELFWPEAADQAMRWLQRKSARLTQPSSKVTSAL
jgi:DNA-binding SARP family transcriptional activator